MIQRTLIIAKPDAFARGLTGEILARFERKGLRIVALKMMEIDTATASEHYAEHRGKPFYDELVDFITSGAVVVAALEGSRAIEAARQVIGATDPVGSTAGTIRGDFALDVGRNLVHGSDSAEAAVREIRLFFGDLGAA